MENNINSLSIIDKSTLEKSNRSSRLYRLVGWGFTFLLFTSLCLSFICFQVHKGNQDIVNKIKLDLLNDMPLVLYDAEKRPVSIQGKVRVSLTKIEKMLWKENSAFYFGILGIVLSFTFLIFSVVSLRFSSLFKLLSRVEKAAGGISDDK